MSNFLQTSHQCLAIYSTARFICWPLNIQAYCFVFDDNMLLSYCALFKNIMFKLSGNVAFYFKKYR